MTAVTDQTFGYGTNLLSALNGYVNANNPVTTSGGVAVTLWNWIIDTELNGGYPILIHPCSNWTDVFSYDTSWYDNYATSFTLTTPAQLAGLAVLISGTDSTGSGYYNCNTTLGVNNETKITTKYAFTNKTITLGNDISLNNNSLTRTWTPIGTNSDPFSGTFDGAGNTVSGLYIVNSSGSEQGLFGTVGGTVQNLAVSGSVSGGTNVGSIAGTVASGGIVQNCYNTGSVNGVTNAGGITGSVASGGTVQNCYNIGSISGTTSVGGIAGSNAGTVSYSYFLKGSSINTSLGAVGSGTSTSSGCFANNEGSLYQLLNLLQIYHASF